MALLRIYTFPNSVLASQAKPVTRVDKSLFGLADDMLETMYHAPGVGLAANQVGILQRIIVLDAEADRLEKPENKVNHTPKIMINPELQHREGTVLSPEACLSVPDFSAKIKRAEKIKVRYQDLDGNTHLLCAEGFLSIVIQHEIDHLDGRLFIDRLTSLKKRMVKRALLKEQSKDF